MKKQNIKRAALAAGILTAAAAMPVLLCAPGFSTKRQRAPFAGANIAHRGLHSRDKSIPENSIAAFRRAVEAGYGVELDVRLTKDGRVVVFHDNDLKRMCGVDSAVDELTFDELQILRLLDTDERIPLFTSVLDVIRGRVPIICEVKGGRSNRELCRKTYDIISSYRGDICIESFDPFIVGWFRRNGKDILRGQLAMRPERYKGQSKLMSFALGNCLMNIIGRPQFIAYDLAKKPAAVKLSEVLGAMRVCWTSHEPKNEKGMDTVIFEYYKPKIRFRH